ncbi:hypothetical protein ACHAWF_007955, partial [Thalassiosira exigua]
NQRQNCQPDWAPNNYLGLRRCVQSAISSQPCPAMPNHNFHISRRFQHAATGIAILFISHLIKPYPTGFLILAISTAAFYILHQKRTHDEEWDRWYLKHFGALLRGHERGEWEELSNGGGATRGPPPQHAQRRRRKVRPALPGAFYFLLGTALSSFLFPAVPFRASLLVLSISDPMAGLAGSWFSNVGFNITWKRILPRVVTNFDGGGKADGGPSIAGSIACAIVTILCTYVYVPLSSAMADAEVREKSEISLSLGSRLSIGLATALVEAMGGAHLPMADDNLLIPLAVGSLICWLC